MPLEVVWALGCGAALTAVGLVCFWAVRHRIPIRAALRRLARWWFYEGWDSG